MTRDNTIKTLRLQLAGATAYSSSSAAQLQEAQVQLQEAGELREQQEEGATALAASRAEAQQLQQQLAKALADLEELQARWAVAWCTPLLNLSCPALMAFCLASLHMDVRSSHVTGLCLGSRCVL